MSLIKDSIPSRGGTAVSGSQSAQSYLASPSCFVRMAFVPLFVVCALFSFVASSWCQTTANTTINLNTQGRNPDFSNFPATRPMTVGTVLPTTCTVGQMFFLTAGPAGANLYGCTAANVWSLESGGGAGNASANTAGVSFNSSSLLFPSQTTGSTSAAQSVTVTNSGSAPLNFSGISMAGANAGDFTQTNNCGSGLAAAATCIITVTYSPSVPAAETAAISIADNATGSPQTISLSGTGVASGGNTSAPVLSPSALVAKAGAPLSISADRSVTWSLAAGSSGSLSTQSGGSTTYIPPTSIVAQNSLAGCMVSPNDSVFNTRIDGLPVHASSATWIGAIVPNPISFQYSWGTNIIDNTVAATTQSFHYTTLANGSFQIPPIPVRNRETGSLTTDGNNDHHLVSLNRQTCHFYETYQDGLPVGGCPGCTAASGLQYDSTSYALPSSAQGGGSTDAAGLPLQPLMLHLSELKAGAVNHALRFTLCTGCINSGTYLWPATTPNGSPLPSAPPMGTRFRLKANFVTTGVFQVVMNSSGYNYTSAPTVTITGCQVAPVATASLYSGSIGAVSLTSIGSGCTNPVVTFAGGGGTGANATAMVFSPAAQIVLKALQQYGMFLADNGISGQIQASTDVTRDAAVVAGLNQITSAQLMPTNFDVVDESSLMVSATSSQINPANGSVTPASYAVLTATDSSGNKSTVPIALQPVTVGTSSLSITFVAGAPAYALTAWVNGSSNQNLTWTLASGPGTLTSNGMYTPPATISALTPAVFVATAAADATASATVYATIVPTGANPAGSVRVDVGNSNSYTDSQGNVWLPDLISSETATFSLQNDNYPSNAWGNIADPALYQTYKYTWGDDLYYGPFVVPNGNYKVNLMFGLGQCSGTYTVAPFDSGLINGTMALESQGQIQVRFNAVQAANYTCRTPATASIPAQVTNNTLYFAVRAMGGANAHSAPYLNAFSITPDSTPAYLSIDTQQVTTVKSGTTAQVYATGWYMSNVVNWSVTGGGSISQSGLYTAPGSVSANQTVTITATSVGTPGISATAILTLTP